MTSRKYLNCVIIFISTSKFSSSVFSSNMSFYSSIKGSSDLSSLPKCCSVGNWCILTLGLEPWWSKGAKKTIVLAFPFNQSLQIIGFASSVEVLTDGYGKVYQMRYHSFRTVDRCFMKSQKKPRKCGCSSQFFVIQNHKFSKFFCNTIWLEDVCDLFSVFCNKKVLIGECKKIEARLLQAIF